MKKIRFCGVVLASAIATFYPFHPFAIATESVSATPNPIEPLSLPLDLLEAATCNAALNRPFPSFDSQRLDEKLILYRQILETSGPPDILIVGSSRALQGVDPVTLQLALANEGHPNLKIFNFGINGATAQVVDMLLRQILTPDQLPKMIVWADGVRAFNSGRVDRTYNAIMSSEGYKQVARGERPIPPNSVQQAPSSPSAPAPVRPSNRPRIPARMPPRGSLPTDTTLVSHYEALNAWVDEVKSAIAQSYVLNQRRVFVDSAVARLPARGPGPTAAPPPPPTDGDTSSSMEVSGFVAVSTRFNPDTYYQQYPRVPGQYDGDYAGFRIEGEQSSAMEQVLNFLQSRQIPVVFVNLPLNENYLDSLRSASERTFQRYMQRLANRQGFYFIDLGQRWVSRHDYFADPSHLNRYGAYAVALQIAQERSVPWSALRR